MPKWEQETRIGGEEEAATIDERNMEGSIMNAKAGEISAYFRLKEKTSMDESLKHILTMRKSLNKNEV